MVFAITSSKYVTANDIFRHRRGRLPCNTVKASRRTNAVMCNFKMKSKSTKTSGHCTRVAAKRFGPDVLEGIHSRFVGVPSEYVIMHM